MEAQFKTEIVELHEFLTGWLSGNLPRSEATYAPFAAVLANDFVIISPSGEVRSRETLVPGLEQAHGAEGAEFRIWIENVQMRWSGDGACLGTYQEWQQDSSGRSARLSSVLFRRNDALRNGIEWVHLHETWLAGHGPDA